MTDVVRGSARVGALVVLCVMALMVVLDSTIVAVAVPVVQRELGFSAAGAAWIVNGYLLGFAGVLMLAGRLGDLVGARRVFLAGLAVFTGASLLCGLSGSAALLVGSRFLQGLGGGLASAVIFSLIVVLYPEPGPQARAIGVYGFTQAGGAATGFVAGGLLTEAVGWPWIFLVNVPIGVAALIVGRRVLPRTTVAKDRGGLDVPGGVVVTLGLSAAVYAIVAASWVAAVVAVALLGGHLFLHRYAESPLRDRTLIVTSLTVVLIFATGMGFQFVSALYLQRVLGYDAIATGLAFVPTPVVIGALSLFATPRLTSRFGPRPVLISGLLPLAGALLLFSRMPVDASYPVDVLPPLVVAGLGMGLVIPSVIVLAMSSARTPDTVGLVSGLTNTAQTAGGALGIAVLAVANAGPGGYPLAYLIAAGLILTAALVTALRRDRVAVPA